MTFWQWLKLQKDRDDSIGDLSKDAIVDHRVTHNIHSARSKEWWVHYLQSHNACQGALDTLEKAWKEYKRTTCENDWHDNHDPGSTCPECGDKCTVFHVAKSRPQK